VADKANKNPENVPGPFYTDTGCIFCQQCIGTAPGHFKGANDDHSYVFKQPSAGGQTDLCKQAQEGCPAGAIGDDGQ
jgi:ferredoxin